MTQLLIIDDDEQLAPLLTQYFARFNLSLDSAAHPQTGLSKLDKTSYDLLILDLMLPDMDGFEVCREVRKKSDIPIIMLTARGDVMDRIVGLELGADDYLPKPFEPRELVARVQNILKRTRAATNNDQPDNYETGGLLVDRQQQQISIHGNPVELSHNEYLLVDLLVSEPRKTFSRDEIMNQLRGTETEFFSRSVDIAISRIRQKLKPLDCIKTHRGAGYSFIPPLS